MTTPNPAGWVVQFSIPQISPTRFGDAPPKFEFFNVAVSDADKAMGAAKKMASPGETTTLSTVRGLSAGELLSLNLKTGDVVAA